MGTLEIFSVTSQALEILDLPTEESVAPPVTEGNITGVSTLGVTPAPSTLHPGVHDPLPFQPTSVADLMREMPVYKLTFSNSTAVGTATSFAPLHALLAALASPLLYQYDLLRYKAIKLRLTPVGCTPSLNGAIRLSGQPLTASQALCWSMIIGILLSKTSSFLFLTPKKFACQYLGCILVMGYRPRLSTPP